MAPTATIEPVRPASDMEKRVEIALEQVSKPIQYEGPNMFGVLVNTLRIMFSGSKAPAPPAAPPASSDSSNDQIIHA